MFVEPPGFWRDARMMRRRTALEWAEQIRALVEAPRYASAECITLVCGNLNTHGVGFTPQHGSWLNIAELELSVLTRQSLSDRLESEEAVEDRARLWTHEHNRKQIGVDWQFTTQRKT